MSSSTIQQTSNIDYLKDRDEYDKRLAKRLSTMSLDEIYKFRDGKLGVELDEGGTDIPTQGSTFINNMRSKAQQEEWERDPFLLKGMMFIQGGPELSDKYAEDGRGPDTKERKEKEEIYGRQYKHLFPTYFDWLPTQGTKKSSPKQKVNDRCACGSGLKYKKCCLNAY